MNKQWLKTLKEDIRMFNLVHAEPGILKYFYQPGFRALIFFRLSQLLYTLRITRPFAYLLVILNDIFCGVWIGPKVSAGPGLFFGHPRGLVVHPQTKIGSYCSIIQRVTLGGPNVTIGDYVELNAGAQIICNGRKRKSLTIGNNVIIGAGALVLQDIPSNSVAVGMPAKVINSISPENNWVNYRKHLQKDVH